MEGQDNNDIFTIEVNSITTHNNSSNNSDNNSNNKKPSKNLQLKYVFLLFVSTIVLSLFEFIYFIILLFIRDNIFKVSLVPNIIKSIFILIYFMCSLIIDLLEKVRISFGSLQYLKIEKIITFVALFSSLATTSISISVIAYYFIFTILNSSCLYQNYCELQAKAGHAVGYTCNYKANEINPDYFKSCEHFSENDNQSPPKYLQNCGDLYYCELIKEKFGYEDKKDKWSCVIFFIVLGIILFICWFITLNIRLIKTIRIMKIKNVKKVNTNNIFYVKLHSDNYTRVLCEHNYLNNNFEFYLEDIKFFDCNKHNNDNSINSSSEQMRVGTKNTIFGSKVTSNRNLFTLTE